MNINRYLNYLIDTKSLKIFATTATVNEYKPYKRYRKNIIDTIHTSHTSQVLTLNFLVMIFFSYN